MNSTIITVVGWPISLIVALWVGICNGRRSQQAAEELSAKNRSTKARDDYRASIASLRSKLRIGPNYNDKFFHDSQPILSEAIERVRTFVCGADWACLNQTWDEYAAQDERFLKRQDPAAIQIFTDKKMPDQILSEFLDRFEKCVTDA